MHLDNQRLRSIQRFKSIIQKKLTETDDEFEKRCLKNRYNQYSKEEDRILSELVS